MALGVGPVLFWLALFFMVGGDKSDELGRLKGEYDALEQVAVLKKCDVSTQLAQARQEREAYAAKLKEQQNPTGTKAPCAVRGGPSRPPLLGGPRQEVGVSFRQRLTD